MPNPPFAQESHVVFFLSFCAWEIMFHLARCLLKKGLANRILGVSSSSDADVRANGHVRSNGHDGSNVNNGNHVRRGSSEDARHTLVQRGPSYLVSLFHSLCVTGRGASHLYHLWNASNYDKLVIGDIGTPYRWAQLEVGRTNAVFLSYLCYDLVHILLQYPRLGGVDTIVHHVAFAACSVINGSFGIMPFAFGWLIVGEASTVLLNARWFLLKSGRCGAGGGGASLLATVNKLFAATFFATRVGAYTAGIAHLFGRRLAELRAVPAKSGVPVPLFGLTCGCIVLGWVLNLFWGYKIMGMIRGKAEPKMKMRKDPQSKLP